MAEPFIGEVKIFAGNFAPRGYALCNGQLLPIAQNTALFSILGTTYGGNGQTTFALPNLQGKAPLHAGQGPGLSPYALGQTAGEVAHTLTSSEVPAHNHALRGSSAATGGTPSPTVVLAATSGAKVYRSATNLVPMATGLNANLGGLPHENRQPCLALNFIIAMQGVFPSRN
jgi:microcystin-dependent protein